jgi:competence protein ComEC
MPQMLRKRVRRTTLLATFYAAILGGVAISYIGLAAPSNFVWLGMPLFAWCLYARSLPGFLVVIYFGLVLGCSRGQHFYQQNLVYATYYEQKVTLEATVSDDAIYGNGGQLSFLADRIVLEGRSLRGKLQISGYGPQAIYQGDRLLVQGKLRETLGSAQGRMSYATIERVTAQPSLIGNIRRTFAAGMTTALPEPLASFSLGLLLGKRTTIPDEIKDDLMKVGLTHIVAVSGYNLTILLNASKSLLAKHSKRLNLLLSLTLIGTFLLLTGASASIVRAAIISTISIAVAYYGRSIKPVHIILLAAAITAYANPFYMWKDMGWYLSFLAFYGILVIAPFLKARLPARLEKSLLAGVAIESISAEIITLPFVVHFFGQMSVAGLPANVLVVTLVPLAMLTSFIAGLAGIAMAPIAGWLAWPATIVLNYILDAAHLIAALPHVFHENIGLSLGQMLGCYTVIFIGSLMLARKTNAAKSDTITDKNHQILRGAELERTQ